MWEGKTIKAAIDREAENGAAIEKKRDCSQNRKAEKKTESGIAGFPIGERKKEHENNKHSREPRSKL